VDQITVAAHSQIYAHCGGTVAGACVRWQQIWKDLCSRGTPGLAGRTL